MNATPHPDGERIDLRDQVHAICADLAEPTPLVRNARVAADVLFRDPPPAYAVRVSEYDVTVQGRDDDGLVEWATRHHLAETPGWHHEGTMWRQFEGVVEGVPFMVPVEVVGSAVLR